MKTNPSPEDILRLRAAADIEVALPAIEAALDEMKQATMSAVFAKISKGQLPEDEAQAYWFELYSYHRLAIRLRSQASAAKQVTETRRLTHGS